MRKPGGSKLVFDRKTRTIKKVKINRFKRMLWWIKEIIGEHKDIGEERITEALEHFKQRADGYKELEERLISERK